MINFATMFFPDNASNFSLLVDGVYVFILIITVIFTVIIYGCIIAFSIIYRRKSDSDRPKPIEGNHFLEALWIIIPTIIVLVMFFSGTALFFHMNSAPKDAMEIYGTGKQWMWKFQHPEGPKEINDLHVPLGANVKMTLTSEDVIHSFYIPAFRIKNDVLPGKYTTVWFKAIKTGQYHLFCAEYCGTKHSQMLGTVTVMEPQDYEKWLAGGSAAEGDSMTGQGEKLFKTNRCNTCHTGTASALGPSLDNIFGSEVELSNGQFVTVDESYVRESIMYPLKKVVKGYQPVMPTYKTLLTEDQLVQIIAYIKSLTPQAQPE